MSKTKSTRVLPFIHGPQWGEHPTDSELSFDTDEDEVVIDISPKISPTKISPDISKKDEYCSTSRYLMEKYSVFPVEVRDDDGKLTALVFNSTENTPSYWCSSMTIRYDDEKVLDSGDESEYEENY